MKVNMLKYLMVISTCCITLIVVACTAPLVKLATAEQIAPESLGHIITSGSDIEVQFSELIKQLSSADYILLGELHDDPRHHALQRKILDALVANGNRPAVVFEMFNREDSGAISSSYRRYPDDPDRIAKTVLWDESGWPEWSMYRPIVKTAMDADLPIVAGNLSRKKAMQIVMQGQQVLQLMEEKTALQMGLLAPLDKNDEQGLHKKIAQSHGGKMPPSMIPGMVMAQRVRDATLAESMITYNRGEGAVLIAGREHVRADYGVPFYLRHRESDARIMSLAFAAPPLSADKKRPLYYSEAYDFIWELPKISVGEKIAHQ